MTSFWFIRHGESESNAGIPVSDEAATPLTKIGLEQARRVAEHILTPPDKFIVSPYFRTQQTAAPTLAKFPGVPVETWPVHEYTYLSHQQHVNTTLKDRRKLSTPYFLTGDPDMVLGEGGESFNQFLERVRTSLDQLRESQDHLTIIFGHGWFMRAILWMLYNSKETVEERKNFRQRLSPDIVPSQFAFWLYSTVVKIPKMKRMMEFLLFSAVVRTPNCAILKFKTADGKIEYIGSDLSHLPNGLNETTLINR